MPSPPPPSSRLREWMLRIGLLTAAVVFLLVTLEIAARLMRSQRGGGKEGREQARYNEYDPLLGWRKTPNTVVQYRRQEYITSVSINSRTLRDPERPVDPPADVSRLLALGDSFVEGYTVDWEKTVTQRLASRLNDAGCATDVINAGTAGYSTDQETLFYASEGARYRAPLVLLFFYYNDILFTDRQDFFGESKPAFEFPDGVLKLHRYPIREKPRAASPPASVAEPQEAARSVALELLRDRLWYGAPDLHDALAKFGWWNPIPRSSPRLELLVYDRRLHPPIEGAWKKVEAVLAFLKGRVQSQGAHLALVYIPSKMEIQDGSWRTTKQLYGIDEQSWDRGKVSARLTEIAQSLDAPMLDLTQALRAGESRFASTYFMADGHWNARGHDVAAKAVFEWMKAGGWTAQACGGRLPLVAPRGDVWTPEPGNAISLPRDD
ncbi:MAG: SGNH/GDSL hydrolase family protein [Vicinamibacteria bacterium]